MILTEVKAFDEGLLDDVHWDSLVLHCYIDEIQKQIDMDYSDMALTRLSTIIAVQSATNESPVVRDVFEVWQ